jgi:hypothetical protein
MSLKGFHIVFVSVSLALFTFLALWGFVLADETGGVPTVMGWVGVMGLLLMPFYGLYFLRKAKRLHL